MLTNRLGPGGTRDGAEHPAFASAADSFVAADAAHELANLMMVVLGSLEQLRRQPLDEQGRQQLSRAEWGARQAARLTRQVLSRAQGRDDRAEIADLNAAVKVFVTALGRRLDGGMQVALDLAPAELPVRLDPGLLDLVLLNLVRNAAEAMPSGGEVVLHTQGPRLDGLGDQLTVEVAVSDSGTGMSPAVAQHATEAFSTTKPHGKGNGLGLWMAERFASAHGGKIDIETAAGRGTKVRLVFPYAGETDPG